MVEFIVGVVVGGVAVSLWERVWTVVRNWPVVKPVVDFVAGLLH